MVKSETNVIKSMLFMDRGMCRVECDFDKDIYQPNEVASVRCMINNGDCRDSVIKV